MQSLSADLVAMLRRFVLPLPLLAGCVGSSPVAVLEPGVFGLTSTGGSQATTVRRGIHAAEAFCARDGRRMAPVRTAIGSTDYRIAFRCLAPFDPLLTSNGLVPLPREQIEAGR